MWFIAFWIAVIVVATGKLMENLKAEGLTWYNLSFIVWLIIEVIFILKFDKWWNSICEMFEDYYE